MDLKNNLENSIDYEQAVSPIIGTLLMIALVVVLSAIVAFAYMSFNLDSLKDTALFVMRGH